MAMDIGRGWKRHSCVNGSQCVGALGGGRFLGHPRAKYPTWLHREQIT